MSGLRWEVLPGNYTQVFVGNQEVCMDGFWIISVCNILQFTSLKEGGRKEQELRPRETTVMGRDSYWEWWRREMRSISTSFGWGEHWEDAINSFINQFLRKERLSTQRNCNPFRNFHPECNGLIWSLPLCSKAFFNIFYTILIYEAVTISHFKKAENYKIRR